MLAASSCRRAIETKSGQNLMFDPGGSKGRLRACPFLGIWRALLCGEVLRLGAGCHPRMQRFLAGRMTWASTCRRGTCESYTPYVQRSIAVSPQRPVRKGHAVEDSSRLSKK